jgi:Fe-Mn family superoxide dismutase
MTLILSELPYSHDALSANGMSKETIEFHHDIHHKAYVDNGNNLLKDTGWENKTLEEIILGTYDANSIAQNGIFNNVSQHWNHEQFWQMMSPSKVNMPSELE